MMDLEVFLSKWRVNKAFLAKNIGLSTSGLYNKLSEKNADKLTRNQKIALAKFIKDLAKDANDVVIDIEN